MRSVLRVSRASALVFGRHAARSLGGVRAAAVIGVAIAALATVVNVYLFRFLEQNLGAALEPNAPSNPAVAAARSALITAQIMIAPVIALTLVILTPPVSRLGPAVRVAGASRRVVAVGELVPLAVSVLVVVGCGGVGPAWFIAVHQESPMSAVVTILVTALAFALSAVALHAVLVTISRITTGSPVIARLIGLVGAFGAVGLVLGDLLRATAAGEPGIAVRTLALIWNRPAGDLDLRSVVGGCVVLVCAAGTLVCARIVEPDDGAFPHVARIGQLRAPEHPGALVVAAGRECLMLLRHPVGQATTATSVVLSGLVVAGALQEVIPLAIAVAAFGMLFSAGAETAYGRSATWRWVRRLAGQRSGRLVWEQYLGVLPVALVAAIATTALVVIPGADDLGSIAATLGSSAVLVGSLSALAYLAGVMLPFDDGAPTAVVGTSLLALAVEGAVLWIGSFIAEPGSVGAAVYEVAVGALALWAAALTTARRA